MSTFALTKSDHAQDWCVYVCVEGVGVYLDAAQIAIYNSDGRYRFCSSVPAFVPRAIEVWRDYLATVPDLLSERVDILGGLPEHGSVTAEILDYDDFLSGLIKPNGAAYAVLTSAINASTTTIPISVTTDITRSLLWIGAECVAVDSQVAGSLTVRRGYAGTTAYSHASQDRCFRHVQYSTGRRINVYLVPLTASAETEAQLVGEYVLDGLSWDSTTNIWQLAGKSQVKFLDRQVPSPIVSPQKVVWARTAVGSGTPAVNTTRSPDWFVYGTTNWPSVGGEDSYVAIGDEIIATGRYTYDAWFLGRRGLLGTAVEDDLLGRDCATVMVAEPTAPGSFRFSPGASPSTTRASGTWTISSHWVDIMLCMLTSSYDASDGLELVNYTGSYGNYSSLPVGFGVGLPASTIDWATWRNVKARTLGYRFDQFVYGDKRVSFGDLITDSFLRPLGAYISYSSGTARLVFPRMPALADVSVSLGPTSILRKEVARGHYMPDVSIKQNTTNQTGSINLTLGRTGRKVSIRNPAYFATHGQRSWYVTDEKPIEIEISGIDPDSQGSEDSMIEIASRRLFRWHRPAIEIDARTDMSLHGIGPGSVVAVTMGDAPNMAGRGMSGVLAEVIEHEIEIEQSQGGDALGASMQIKAITYNDVGIRGIAPSAIVTTAGTAPCYVQSSRYSASDGIGTLPTSDALSFAVGDRVRLINRDGSAATSPATTYQTITGVADEEISIDGNFGGVLAAGLVLTAVRYDDATAARKADLAYQADTQDQYIGTSTDTAIIYGEP